MIYDDLFSNLRNYWEARKYSIVSEWWWWDQKKKKKVR